MGHLDFGTMQRLNIEAARKHAGQSELVTPGPPTGGGGGGGGGNGGGVTPISLNTPDILNSLLNINPFFETPSTVSMGSSSTFPGCPDSLIGTPEEPEKKVFANLDSPQSSCALAQPSSSAAIPSTSATLVTNPMLGGPPMASTSTSHCSLPPFSLPPHASQSPPSVDRMRSNLIKASLKHSIQSKRKSSGKGELDVTAELVVKHRKKEELTPEDEERRRRRRERNKIAATKCRNKKKEKTLLLIQESESLEGNNVSLKSEISKLETERQQLVEALAAHAPVCSRVLGANSNLSNDSRGGTSGGGGGGGGAGSRNLSSAHSMVAPQFSTGHHQSVSGCYSTGQTHHSQIHGGGGLPHHHHHNSYHYSNASIQLS